MTTTSFDNTDCENSRPTLAALGYLSDASHFRRLWLRTGHSEHLGACRAVLQLARRANAGRA